MSLKAWMADRRPASVQAVVTPEPGVIFQMEQGFGLCVGYDADGQFPIVPLCDDWEDRAQKIVWAEDGTMFSAPTAVETAHRSAFKRRVAKAVRSFELSR